MLACQSPTALLIRRLLYAGSAAYQEDFAENPGDFSLWYILAEAGLGYGNVKSRLGYELLEGDVRYGSEGELALFKAIKTD